MGENDEPDQWQVTRQLTRSGKPRASLPNPYAASLALSGDPWFIRKFGYSASRVRTSVDYTEWEAHLTHRREAGLARYEVSYMHDVLLAALFDADAVAAGRYRLAVPFHAVEGWESEFILLGLQLDGAAILPACAEDYLNAPQGYKEVIVKSRGTPRWALSALASDPTVTWECRLGLARNDLTPPETLELIERLSREDSDYSVSLAVAKNPSAGNETLRRLLELPPLERPHWRLSDVGAFEVFVALVRRVDFPMTVEELAPLVGERHVDLRKAVRKRLESFAAEGREEDAAMAYFLLAQMG